MVFVANLALLLQPRSCPGQKQSRPKQSQDDEASHEVAKHHGQSIAHEVFRLHARQQEKRIGGEPMDGCGDQVHQWQVHEFEAAQPLINLKQAHAQDDANPGRGSADHAVRGYLLSRSPAPEVIGQNEKRNEATKCAPFASDQDGNVLDACREKHKRNALGVKHPAVEQFIDFVSQEVSDPCGQSDQQGLDNRGEQFPHTVRLAE